MNAVWRKETHFSVYHTVLLGTVCFLLASSILPAQMIGPVTRVEEDWELVLSAPDGDLLAPQLHTVISPFADLDTYYAQITWNYRELPDFAPGGFQVQGWVGENVVDVRSFDLEAFSRQSERFIWTQVMAVSEGWTAFAVVNGFSPTWGSFGGIEAVIYDFTGLSDLSAYSPEVSVRNSLITYGANRVQWLGIREVRYFGPDGELLYRDVMPRVVYGGEYSRAPNVAR